MQNTSKFRALSSSQIKAVKGGSDEKQPQAIQILSNIVKIYHDTAKSAIQNMRA